MATRGDIPALARSVHRRRLKLGLTAGDLAERAGVARSTISRLENQHTSRVVAGVLLALDRGLDQPEGTLLAIYRGEIAEHSPATDVRLVNDDGDPLTQLHQLAAALSYDDLLALVTMADRLHAGRVAS